VSYELIIPELCDDKDSVDVIKHLRLVVNAKKVAAEFDTNIGNQQREGCQEDRHKVNRQAEPLCSNIKYLKQIDTKRLTNFETGREDPEVVLF
jgi:hypothetical protein